MARFLVAALAILVVVSASQPEEDLSYLTPDMTEIHQHHVDVSVDSETIPIFRTSGGAVSELVVLYETVVKSPGSSWMKLEFGDVELGVGREEGPYLRLTSMLDGAVQYLDHVSIQEWYMTSAYFNGDAVKVELLARASPVEARSARVQVVGAMVGEDTPVDSNKSICDGIDLRIYSPEQQKSARYIGSGGCTGWIWNDRYNCFHTAGHCGVNAQRSGTMQFNVPLSSTTGAIRHPPPEDQFSVDAASVQMVNGGVGNDWGYLGTFLNSNTGRSAIQHNGGQLYNVITRSPPTDTSYSIHIAGFGVCETNFPQGACRSREYSQVNKNDTHTGSYTLTGTSTLRYRTDTTGGNSGSGVEIVYNFRGAPSSWRFEAVGIHTHGGCTASGGSNAGTALQNAGWTTARANPRGVCATGPQNTPLRLKYADKLKY